MLNEAIFSIIQPNNNQPVERKSDSNTQSKDNDFSDVFDNVSKAKADNTNRTDKSNNDSAESNKTMHVEDERKNGNQDGVAQIPKDDWKEDISAKEFLEKLGMDESEIKKIMQNKGLDENISLLDFLKSFNFILDMQDSFLQTSLIDFLDQLDLGKEAVQNLVDNLENIDVKQTRTEFGPAMSLNNLLENIGVSQDALKGQKNVKIEDLTVNQFLSKLGLNESKFKNLLKEFGINQQLLDGALKITDLLKKGLSSDELAKIAELSLEDSNEINKFKKLHSNSSVNDLKTKVLLDKNNINFPEEPLRSALQNTNNKNASEVLLGKTQSDSIFPTTPLTTDGSLTTDGPSASPGQTSGLVNIGHETNGLFRQLANNSNNILQDFSQSETTSRSFFEKTVMDQIVSKVNFRMSGGQEEIRIHLEPPSLGSLNLKVSVEGKIVHAAVIADNQITKEIIQSNIQQLRDSMIDQGLKLESLSVSVGGEGADGGANDFNSFFNGEQTDQDAQYENENYGDLLDQNIEITNKHSNSIFPENGVDLIV